MFGWLKKQKEISEEIKEFIEDNNIHMNFSTSPSTASTTFPDSDKSPVETQYNVLEDGLTIPEIVLLWWCDGRKESSFWSSLHYGDENNSKFMAHLIELEYARFATLEESLPKLLVSELKNILREYKLPISGKKAVLICRIRENLTSEQFESFIHDKYYKITASGEKMLPKYKNIIWGFEHNREYYAFGIDEFLFENLLDVNPEEYAQNRRDDIHQSWTKENLEKLSYAGLTKYEFSPCNDERTCEKCNQLNQMVFNISDAKIGENLPQIHSGCRCTVMGHWETNEAVLSK